MTRYDYDGRDHRTWTYDPRWSAATPTYKVGQEYDGLGRVVATVTYQNSVEIRDRRAYDAYGNLTAEIDAEGRVKTHVYGAFARLEQDIDEGGDIVAYCGAQKSHPPLTATE